MHYTDEGTGLPVLFVPAFPYHRGQWEGQRAALRGKARFLSMDVRGMRDEAPRAFMLEHVVDDIISLLDERGIDRAVLCGCSLGGYAALRLVERAPERVRGLLLVDAVATPDSDETKLSRAGGLRTLAQEGVRAFAAAQLKRQLSPGASVQVRERLGKIIEECTPEGIAAAFVALATRTDTRGALAKIDVPTRVIVGADDPITTPALVRALAEAIPNATFHEIPNAGHIPNAEAEPQFNALLTEFLAGFA